MYIYSIYTESPEQVGARTEDLDCKEDLIGVLHSKTEYSKFNKYYLPAINVAELVKNDISFVLDWKQR